MKIKIFPLVPHLANFDQSLQSYRQKNKQHLGKKSTANFATYLHVLPFTGQICPFVGKKASQNFAQNKGNIVGNKTGEGKGKGKRKRARKKIEID